MLNACTTKSTSTRDEFLEVLRVEKQKCQFLDWSDEQIGMNDHLAFGVVEVSDLMELSNLVGRARSVRKEGIIATTPHNLEKLVSENTPLLFIEGSGAIDPPFVFFVLIGSKVHFAYYNY